MPVLPCSLLEQVNQPSIYLTAGPYAERLVVSLLPALVCMPQMVHAAISASLVKHEDHHHHYATACFLQDSDV